MRIDQQLVIEAEDRVVERRGMQMNGDAFMSQQRPVMQECGVDSGAHRLSESFLLASAVDNITCGVPEEEPDLAAFIRAATHCLDKHCVLFGKEERGVREDIYVIVGSGCRLSPEVLWNVRAMGIERNQLHLAAFGPTEGVDLRPQVRWIGREQLCQALSVLAVRGTTAEPSLDCLVINAEFLTNLCRLQPCACNGGPQAVIAQGCCLLQRDDDLGIRSVARDRPRQGTRL